MAKNELISLSLVSRRPMHGYAISEALKCVGLTEWGKVSTASIYNTLNRLAKEGCVKVARQKMGNMPERKVYTISKKGEKRLNQEARAALASLYTGDVPFNMAITFGMGVNSEEMSHCLKDRIGILKHNEGELKNKLKRFKRDGISHAAIMVETALKCRKLERETALKLISLLEKDPGYYSRMMDALHECGNCAKD